MNIEQITTTKILTLGNLVKTINGFKLKGKTIVFTNGCFDLLHSGHLHSISVAKSFGDYLIVGINTDASVKRLKGEKRPIQNQEERALMLASLSFVDYVILFEEDTPQKLIEKIVPDVLIKGGDYKLEEIVGADVVLKNNGRVEMIPLLEGFSTTNAIEKIKKLS